MLEQADIEPGVKVLRCSRTRDHQAPHGQRIEPVSAHPGFVWTRRPSPTQNRPAEAHQRVDRAKRPPVEGFDLVQGLSGLGSYHLSRQPDHEVTRFVLAYLVRLTGPCSIRPDCRCGG